LQEHHETTAPISEILMTRSIGRRVRVWVVCVLVLAGGVGCSGSGGAPAEQTAPQVVRLKQIYLMAQMRTKGNQTRPKTLNEFKQSEAAYPQGFKALQEGDCVFVWSAYTDSLANPAETVLAYEKDAPNQGGYAVMADGTIKQLTADELKAALPAK
jgi:hypothetical protein